MKRISITVTNDLVTDQRLHRTAQTLWEEGYHVTVIGRKLPNSVPISRQYASKRLKLIFSRGPLFYVEHNFRLFLHLLFFKTDILLAVDLDTLPANYVVSKIRNKKLIFDAHELFTEVPELVHRKTTKNFWLAIEKIFVPRIKYSFTVCESIAKEYNKRYRINMGVIRNVPTRKNMDQEVKNLEFIPKMPFVIYQGAINLGRGLELLVDAFEHINGITCLIVGDGDIYDPIKDRIKNRNLTQKVFLTGKIPFNELFSITRQAALGVSIEENLGLNYYYALPNKLFDYIQARVPVLVSDFPEMGRIVKDYNIGETLQSRNPEHLAQQITNMLNNPKYNEWKQNTERAANELTWENEKVKLLEIIKQE